MIPSKLLTEDYRVPSTLFGDVVSCNFNKTYLTYSDRGAYTEEDEGEIGNEESIKEEEPLAKYLIHLVAAPQLYDDIGMCIPGEALKEGNNELTKAKDHQVLNNIPHDVVFDCIIEELPTHKSHENDTANEEIVIANREDEAFTRKNNYTDVKHNGTDV